MKNTVIFLSPNNLIIKIYLLAGCPLADYFLYLLKLQQIECFLHEVGLLQ